MSDKDYGRLLSDPFEEHDIEWRVQRSGAMPSGGSGWAIVIAYVTNRAVQQRLDDVFGVEGWENVYQKSEDGKGYLCGLKVKFGDTWVTKWDGAEYTNVEPLKGALSGAMKRAAVQLGIGRYLYNIDEQWVECTPVNSRRDCQHNFINIKVKGQQSGFPAQWATPKLQWWALPSVKAEQLMERMSNSKDLNELRQAFADAHKYATSFNRSDLLKKFSAFKDERKSALEAIKQQELEQERDQVSEAINLQYQKEVDTLRMIPNERSFTLALNKARKALAEKCEEAGVDFSPFEDGLLNLSAERNQDANVQ